MSFENPLDGKVVLSKALDYETNRLMEVQLEARDKELQQRLSKPKYCQAYITTGCFDPNCNIQHVEKAEVDKHMAGQKALAAAKQKAKKKARTQSVG